MSLFYLNESKSQLLEFTDSSYLSNPYKAISQINKYCKTRENSNFLKNGKIVISVKIRNFSKYRMTKQTSPLRSSRKI